MNDVSVIPHPLVKDDKILEISSSHVGVCTDNAELIRDILLDLPGQDIYLYAMDDRIQEELIKVQLPGKKLHCSILEGFYPERELFYRSRVISQKRAEELESIEPSFFLWNGNSNISLKNLAIRRLSLSLIYREISFYLAFEKHVKEFNNAHLLFLAKGICQNDILSYTDKDEAPSPVLIVPVPLSAKVMAKITKPPQHPHKKRRRLIKEAIHKIKFCWTKLPFDLEACWNRVLLLALRKDSEKVLIPINSLNAQKVHYYSVLFRPVIRKFLEEGKSVKVLFLSNLEEQTFESFKQKISQGMPSGKLIFTKNVSTPFKKIINVFNHLLPDFKAEIENAICGKQYTISQKITLMHAFSTATSLKRQAILTYNRFRMNDFKYLVGLEEDIECISIMNLFKQLHPNQFQSYLIPSCLPEYSECYDCVDVDHFFMHHQFVQRIFEDQHCNTKHYHVVGSTEWEEPLEQDAKLPADIELLVEKSDLVLGVYHQPLFTQYHNKVLYDNLVVNFPDIYQRFLEQHPDACILIKPHRSDNLELIQSLLPDSPRIKILPIETSNQALYKIFDVVLSIHSTTLLHSIAHGVPVIALYKYPDYQAYYDFIEDMNCLATNSHDEALAWLSRFRNDTAFRDHVQEAVSRYHRQRIANPASEQILRIINNT